MKGYILNYDTIIKIAFIAWPILWLTIFAWLIFARVSIETGGLFFLFVSAILGIFGSSFFKHFANEDFGIFIDLLGQLMTIMGSAIGGGLLAHWVIQHKSSPTDSCS